MLEPDNITECSDYRLLLKELVQLTERRNGFLIRHKDFKQLASGGHVLRVPIGSDPGTWEFGDGVTSFLELKITSWITTVSASIEHKMIGVTRVPTLDFKPILFYHQWHAWRQFSVASECLAAASRSLSVYLPRDHELPPVASMLSTLGFHARA